MGIVDREEVAQVLGSGQTFLTFGGTETHLLFQQGFPLREFCAFEVLRDEAAFARMVGDLVHPTAEAAFAAGHGLITDACLWRASPDYVAKLGYAAGDLASLNREAMSLMRQVLADFERARSAEGCPLVLAADLGPRGDGYALGPGEALSAATARDYHAAQIAALAETEASLLVALTLTHVAEAVGLAQAARDHAMPLIVSPTVETNGELPDGTTLGHFIEQVDEATGGYPLFYMVNCAHPTHVASMLEAAEAASAPWLARFKGFRANASAKSHQELDNSTALDRGEPQSLAAAVAALHNRYGLRAVGGCCGTDTEHLAAIAEACRS